MCKEKQFESIKNKIYPIVRKGFFDKAAVNGKELSEKDTTAVAFISDLIIMFSIQNEDGSYKVLKDELLPESISVDQLYGMACENLVRDVEYVIGNTWDGAYAVIADGMKEASALCLRHIWDVCAEKLEDDLVIMAPSAETVLFAPAGKATIVKHMMNHAEQSYMADETPISRKVFKYDRKNRELKCL